MKAVQNQMNDGSCERLMWLTYIAVLTGSVSSEEDERELKSDVEGPPGSGERYC